MWTVLHHLQSRTEDYTKQVHMHLYRVTRHLCRLHMHWYGEILPLTPWAEFTKGLKSKICLTSKIKVLNVKNFIIKLRENLV